MSAATKPFEERRSGAAQEEGRPPWDERDRARVIHSSAFRRLQSKMQVLGIAEGDFHRTRLTHTLEVAQIGSGIVSHLERTNTQPDILEILPSRLGIEAICLAHDLGHPPFGHGGEVALDYCNRKSGGFEGNGQTLRLVARLEPHTVGYGLDLTRRTMLGVLKYPVAYSELCRHESRQDERPPRQWKPPKCYLNDETDVVTWILEPFDSDDRRRLTETEAKDKHLKTRHKAFDTSIMEAADDIAYGVHDLEDGIALGMIVQSDWETAHTEGSPGLDQLAEAIGLSGVKGRLFSADDVRRKRAIGELIHFLILSCSIDSTNATGFHHPLLSYQVVLVPEGRALLRLLNGLTRRRIIERPEVRSLEWRGQEMIRQLYAVLDTHGEDFLPAGALSGGHRGRDICDAISRMTDEQATRMYERLFVPRQRTAFERI